MAVSCAVRENSAAEAEAAKQKHNARASALARALLLRNRRDIEKLEQLWAARGPAAREQTGPRGMPLLCQASLISRARLLLRGLGVGFGLLRNFQCMLRGSHRLVGRGVGRRGIGVGAGAGGQCQRGDRRNTQQLHDLQLGHWCSFSSVQQEGASSTVGSYLDEHRLIRRSNPELVSQFK